jgi:hypothetical protein
MTDHFMLWTLEKGHEACFKNGRGTSAVIAQGLKPLVTSTFFGTTEVVPFQDSRATAAFIQPLWTSFSYSI